MLENLNLTFITTVAASITGIVTFAWPLWTYIDTRKRDQDLKEFENYHKLIKELVEGDNGTMYIDRQTAVVYELKKFKRYFPISYRILSKLRDEWGKRATEEKVENKFKTLLKETNLTIRFLEKYKDKE